MAHKTIPLIPFIFFLIFIPFQAPAQSFSLDEYPVDTTTIHFEYSHPFFDMKPALSILSGGYNLSLHLPLGKRINIVGIIPFSALGGKDIESSSSIGNIYLGIQTRIKGNKPSGISFSAGVSLPTTSDTQNAPIFVGTYSDLANFYRHTPDLTTAKINLAYHFLNPRKSSFSFHFGAITTIPTDSSDEDLELYAYYGAGAGVWFGRAILSVELHSLAIISQDIDYFGDRFIHSLLLAATYDHSSIKPSLFFRLYLVPGIFEAIDAIVGLKLAIPLT
jgi:hypothetical protein